MYFKIKKFIIKLIFIKSKNLFLKIIWFFNICNILQDHLIKFNIQNEDETPKIQIISDVNTYSVLIFIEKGFELHLENNFQRILGYDYPILKNVMQRSNKTPKVNRLNYIKIFLNIVDNKTQENFLTKVFVQSSVGNLNLYRQDSIYKTKNILNSQFEYIEVTYLNESNEAMQFKDFLVFHYILCNYI